MISLPTNFIDRAKRQLNLEDFASRSVPIPVFDSQVVPPVDRQYILRMMVRGDTLPLSIPRELNWLQDTIHQLVDLQQAHQLYNPFVYVTVRHGIVTSVSDDEWHVDGFSMRTPHVPEQDYICTHGIDPTEYLLKKWELPSTFNPLVHNIHQYFRDFGSDGQLVCGELGKVYAMDPYCVHRRPLVATGKLRTFWRISFIPIEVEDDTCTQNPLFPHKVYNNSDIRRKLVAWPSNIVDH